MVIDEACLVRVVCSSCYCFVLEFPLVVCCSLIVNRLARAFLVSPKCRVKSVTKALVRDVVVVRWDQV